MNTLKIAVLKDGTIARQLLNYPTKNDALSALYSELNFATANPNCVSCIMEMIDDNGRVVKYERYIREEVLEVTKKEEEVLEVTKE